MLAVDASGLTVSPLGAGGQDGVSIDLRGLSRTITLGFGPAGLALPAGGQLRFSADGMVNDMPGRFYSTLRLEPQAGGVVLNLDSGAEPVSARVRVEAYNGAALAGSADLSAAGLLGTVLGEVRLESVSAGEAEPSGSWVLWDTSYDVAVTFRPAGAAGSLTGDRIRVVALNPIGALQNLGHLRVTGSGVDPLSFPEEIAPRFRPRLRLEARGQRWDLKWDTRSGLLQTAPAVDGPWTDLVEGTNQVEVPITAPMEFYRVQVR
jgi:hypothetical protein